MRRHLGIGTEKRGEDAVMISDILQLWGARSEVTDEFDSVGVQLTGKKKQRFTNRNVLCH